MCVVSPIPSPPQQAPSKKCSVSSLCVLHTWCVFAGASAEQRVSPLRLPCRWGAQLFPHCHQSTKDLTKNGLHLSWEMKTGYVKPWFPWQLSDVVTGEVWVETTHGVLFSSYIKGCTRFWVHSSGFLPPRLLLSGTWWSEGRCCVSPQQVCWFWRPGSVDWFAESSVTTFPSALAFSTTALHRGASAGLSTSRYANATRTRTGLPACITVSTALRCSQPTSSKQQPANDPKCLGCMNHR